MDAINTVLENHKKQKNLVSYICFYYNIDDYVENSDYYNLYDSIVTDKICNNEYIYYLYNICMASYNSSNDNNSNNDSSDDDNSDEYLVKTIFFKILYKISYKNF